MSDAPDQIVTIAVIGAVSAGIGVGSTILMNFMNNRARAKDNADKAKADAAALVAANARLDVIDRRAREDRDEVKRQAAAAAALLRENTARVEEATREATKTLASATKTTNDKLDVLHTLTNSNYTAAKVAELAATERELAMMHLVAEMSRSAGREPTAKALAAIDATESRVVELRDEIAERHKQAQVVEDQQANQRREGARP